MKDVIYFSRKELFDAVWSCSMNKLSKMHGISDVGIKKKCIKYKIPTPQQGYWAKKRAGHKINTPNFPLIEYNPKIKFIIYWPKGFRESFSSIKEKVDKLTIPRKIYKPIKVVQETQEAYKYAICDRHTNILDIPYDPKILKIRVKRKMLPWTLNVYNSIFRALEKLDYKIEYLYFRGGNEIVATKNGVGISMDLYGKEKAIDAINESDKNGSIDLLVLKIYGSYGDEVIMTESKKHGFEKRLGDIVKYIEMIIFKSNKRMDELRRDKLKIRKRERLAQLVSKRKIFLNSLKRDEKSQFDNLVRDATIKHNCDIVRQYIKVMEVKWRKDSPNLSNDQILKLKDAKNIVNRFDPLVSEYKNLQDLYLEANIFNKPWKEIQQTINDWLKI